MLKERMLEIPRCGGGLGGEDMRGGMLQLIPALANGLLVLRV